MSSTYASTEKKCGPKGRAARVIDERRAQRQGAVGLPGGDNGELPSAYGAFDTVFHFGGITLFDDLSHGIFEMTCVVKESGWLVCGEEGVAPWLKGDSHSCMVVVDYLLGDADSLIARLPFSATSVDDLLESAKTQKLAERAG